jgi:hypothetical protein
MPRESLSRKRGQNWHAHEKFFPGYTISTMNSFSKFLETLLGLSADPKGFTFVQVSVRGIIVFLTTLIMVWLGHKRSLAHKTPFDALLLVILAAVLSRAINGSAAFFPYSRWRRSFGIASPCLRPARILFAPVWNFGEGFAGHHCA